VPIWTCSLGAIAICSRTGASAALIAQTCGNGSSTVVAEPRYALGPDRLECEFALSVAEDFRHKGLGTQLLAEIECRARALGARRLVGDVLRSNETMQAFARKAGFTMTAVPADARLIRVVKDLATSSAASPCEAPAASELPIAA
jgi:GNAT superfamily N-acetyltransferase